MFVCSCLCVLRVCWFVRLVSYLIVCVVGCLFVLVVCVLAFSFGQFWFWWFVRSLVRLVGCLCVFVVCSNVRSASYVFGCFGGVCLFACLFARLCDFSVGEFVV